MYRPLQGYGDLNLATNNLYSNYNAMQVAWARHARALYYSGELHLAEGPGHRRAHDRSVQSRTQLRRPALRSPASFNAAYSIDLGNRVT